MNVHDLCTDRRGSVAVEFATISVLLVVFIFFLTDLVVRQATIGRLDRVSYSVAGTLRERIQLYDAREELNQRDVDQIAKLAARMLTDMHEEADLSKLKLVVEELHFEDATSVGNTNKEISFYRSWQSGSGSSCAPPQTLNRLIQLAPKGSYGRWVPLYQVTVCLPTTSWYTRLTTSRTITPLLSSFAIVMAR
ncbi:flp pilus assembly surface protein TadF [Izhakiella australiensis]|uniref:Flp pilus assembly surface protein TadF n=1 Tax=Izhakiella australiensis TaxID=1926881 RepID=A0A1S8YSW1_9GAMM|nr:tight adherence pilus pseudopilin TadF [Izhakiella australiensis]OON42174.1 flp pilus assembly surface protein TadF [Izhakiella australiensis]